MPQKDYIVRVAEDVGRALAQIIYHKKIQDYEGALSLRDDLLKQSVGMGSGFLHAVSEETLLASQLTNDPLIDELTDLLYEAAIRSKTPRKEIGEIVRGFLAAYADADRVLCSVCTEAKTDYIRHQ